MQRRELKSTRKWGTQKAPVQRRKRNKALLHQATLRHPEEMSLTAVPAAPHPAH